MYGSQVGWWSARGPGATLRPAPTSRISRIGLLSNRETVTCDLVEIPLGSHRLAQHFTEASCHDQVLTRLHHPDAHDDRVTTSR